MKIRRFRLRGAPRFPVVVEPPPADLVERMADTVADARRMGVTRDEIYAALTTLTGAPAVVVPLNVHRKDRECPAEF